MKQDIVQSLGEKPRLTFFALLTIVFCLSVFIASPAIAKFTSGSEGTTTAQIAAFAADAGGSSRSAMLLDSSEKITTAHYSFWVTNSESAVVSEVASKYSIVLTFPQKLPEGISVLVDGQAGNTSLNGLIYTFHDDSWTFKSGASEKNDHTLTFQADFDVMDEDFTIDDINICVKIEQV